MPGRVGSTSIFFAQFAHDDAQVMRVIEVRTTPTLLHDLTRDHLASVVRGPNQIFLRTEDKSFVSRGGGVIPAADIGSVDRIPRICCTPMASPTFCCST